MDGRSRCADRPAIITIITSSTTSTTTRTITSTIRISVSDGIGCLHGQGDLVDGLLRIVDEQRVSLGTGEVHRGAAYGQAGAREGGPEAELEAARRVDLDALAPPAAHARPALVAHTSLMQCTYSFITH